MLIFKIVHAAEWREAEQAGIYRGSEKDRADGFLHFSTTEQLEETLRRHYAGERGELTLVAVESRELGDALKWEPSRGGGLFPHLYAALPTKTAKATLFTHYLSLLESDFAALRLFLAEIG